jgi:membrane protein implicated in regulation of membrane protease activity
LKFDINKLEAVDIIVLSLTLVIGIFILLSTTSALFTGIPMGEMKARLIASIITSLVSVLSLYVGHRLGKNHKEKENE